MVRSALITLLFLGCILSAGCPAAPADEQTSREAAEVSAALESLNDRLGSIENRLAALEGQTEEAAIEVVDSPPARDPLAEPLQPLETLIEGEPPPLEEEGGAEIAAAETEGPAPIAGWNWAPWQEVAAGTRLGVVAFHIDGIDRVEFDFGAACGKVAVTEATLNEDSGTLEYHAPVPEGATQVNAMVYGRRGPPRELGVREFNPPRDDVLVLHDQRIEGPIDPAGKRHLWLQNCELVGGGHWIATTFQSIYAIDCRASGPNRFFQKVELVRNCTVDGFAGDAFRDCRMVINCTAKNQNRIDNGVHPDVVQFYQGAENAIIYGLTAIEGIAEQGIFSRGKGVEHKGVAIVNCKLNLSGFPAQNQWSTRTHHFVVEGNEFLGAPFTINMDDTVATGFRGSTDIAFRNNTFQWVKILPDDSSVRAAFRGNRFINRWPAYVSDRAGKEVGELIGEEAMLIQN